MWLTAGASTSTGCPLSYSHLGNRPKLGVYFCRLNHHRRPSSKHLNGGRPTAPPTFSTEQGLTPHLLSQDFYLTESITALKWWIIKTKRCSAARTQSSGQAFLRPADTELKHFGLLHAVVPDTSLGLSVLKHYNTSRAFLKDQLTAPNRDHFFCFLFT